MTVDELCASTGATQVKARGWALARTPSGSHELLSVLEAVARQFGTPLAGRQGRLIDRLNPRSQGEAHPKSLSAIHGAGAFPLHTDGAHLTKPPRFIALGCQAAGSSPVPTVLVQYDSLGLAESTAADLSAAPFLVSNGRRSFYSTICDEKEMRVRYDRGCMRPASSQSAKLAVRFDDALSRAPRHIHRWAPGDILVLDNWRVLHGRGLGAGMSSSDRTLLRVTIQ
jgi:Taurine catabolism dioxygenase TauD, TfdA family